MSQNVFDLERVAHPSRVLGQWLSERKDGLVRAGLVDSIQGNVTVTSSDNDAMRQLFAPIASSSGYAVNDSSAMRVSTVYACLDKLAGAMLQLPVHQYRVNAQGDREQMQPTSLWWMLNESPSEAWTSAAWKEWIIRCWGLRGDQHTEILRGQSPRNYGECIGLLPHHPDCVRPRRNGRRLAYDVFDLQLNKVRTLDQDDMLHFSGFGFDGLRSLGPIEWAARNAIGNSLAGAEFMGRTIGEGAMPQIALTTSAKMDKPQAQALRESFVATYGGAQGRKFPLVLQNGMTAAVLSIKPIDMELMAARGFEKDDICEAIGVPSVLIGRSEKTTSWGTGVEQLTLGFIRYSLKPKLCRWEEELNRKLFRRAGMFLEFNLDALMRGDSKAQAEYFRAAIGGPGTGNGWMTVDQVRRMTNQPPMNGKAAELYRVDTAQPAGTPPAP
jgi:HK97 family phage portal protein